MKKTVIFLMSTIWLFAMESARQLSQNSLEQDPAASNEVDTTFFILLLVGFVIVEIVIIFNDYIKPKYFDDLY
jgi:hypothetical protein